MRVFITGGTGLVGSRLVQRLIDRGDQPVVLTRRPDTPQQRWGDRCTVVAGDPTQSGDWTAAMGECDSVVHLAGENLFARRWSGRFKEQLRTSRLDSTGQVAQALSKSPRRGDGSPKALVSASAIGIYGPHGDEELDENAPAGHDFLAELCRDWEQAAQPAADAGVRVVRLRTGIVLDRAGGALSPMLLQFRLFAGGPIGSGRQYMSWIHHEDEIGIILLALDNPQAQGPINATAPNPVTNREFTRALGRALHRPSFLPTPAFALRVTIGEAANVIATGQRVLPTRALQLGYIFRFPEVEGALGSMFGDKAAPTPAAERRRD